MLALAGALIGPAFVARAQAQDAMQLLRDAVSAYSKYSYVGQVQNVDFGTSRALAVLFRIEHRVNLESDSS